jgi:hypothetical protein
MEKQRTKKDQRKVVKSKYTKVKKKRIVNRMKGRQSELEKER